MSSPEIAREGATAAWVRWLVAGVTLLALGVVGIVTFRGGPADGVPVPGTLATVNAALNLTASVLLGLGYAAIRARRVAVHRAFMVAAVAASVLFLVGYVLHHASVGSVRFQGEGAIRAVYFAILIPHVILAAPVVPLALLTFARGLRGQHPGHRRLARITLPLWWFVSASGVAIYFLLYGVGASAPGATP